MVADGKVGGAMGRRWIYLGLNVVFLVFTAGSCFLRWTFFLLLGHAFTVFNWSRIDGIVRNS